jgi:hypothetical protein
VVLEIPPADEGVIDGTVMDAWQVGAEPTVEVLLDWLQDRWLLRRVRDDPAREGTSG